MFLSLIKKEFKQFFRSKGNVFILLVFPIILIATLSLGLDSMMTSSNILQGDEKENIIYYTVEHEENKYLDGFNAFIKGIKKEINVDFIEVTSLDKVKGKIDDKKAINHITLREDGFNIYTSSEGEMFKSKIIRGILEGVLNNYAIYETIYEYNPEALENLVNSKVEEFVEEDSNTKKREVTAAEYYTFAELALIILYISIQVGETVYKENQLNTINRIRLSKIKETTILGAKVTFGTIIGLLQILLVYLFTTYVLKVDWGENIFKFIILFIVFAFFSAVIGALVGIVAKKDTTVSSILNTIIIVICMLGGCYTPLAIMVNIPIMGSVLYISPIYWINTATSSMICGYESSAYYVALIVPIVLSIIAILIYLLTFRKKGELQNA